MIGLKVEHPGIILREEYLEPLGITQTQLARETGISYLRVNELVNGKRGITPDTAMRLARYLGTSAQYWMNWQSAFDLQKAEAEHHKEYERIPVFAQ
ncbi:MAG: HigA family addiction module antidote protein [Nitrospinae bacterium]|nr:HigA family addiction module antidote protein [Nitrospinota bacterium]